VGVALKSEIPFALFGRLDIHGVEVGRWSTGDARFRAEASVATTMGTSNGLVAARPW
jgi:hypothetical protein